MLHTELQHRQSFKYTKCPCVGACSPSWVGILVFWDHRAMGKGRAPPALLLLTLLLPGALAWAHRAMGRSRAQLGREEKWDGKNPSGMCPKVRGARLGGVLVPLERGKEDGNIEKSLQEVFGGVWAV